MPNSKRLPRKKRVTGIGGIFFKSKDPQALKEWYRVHLGIICLPHGSALFEWREIEPPGRTGQTVWAPFPIDTGYFNPSHSSFMINYRVADLSRLLKQLRSDGVLVDDKVEECEYGKFGWIMDPEGNRIELWEPAKANRQVRKARKASRDKK
ncbi:MAG TPA: VOC family protein [Acidobacteriota bacterium]|nr:VOC family protein [Acidobacteriota bacterium]